MRKGAIAGGAGRCLSVFTRDGGADLPFIIEPGFWPNRADGIRVAAHKKKTRVIS